MSEVSNTAVRSTLMPAATTHPRTTDTPAGNLRTLWMVLRITFSLVPIVAGLDKFTDFLTNWDNYLNPMVASVLPFTPHMFMGVVGVIEIAAGIIVFYRPRLGALIVTAWLGCIALSLLASGHYLDVAVRDLVMSVAAFTLAGITPLVESDGRREQ